MEPTFTFKGKVQLYTGKAAWHFLTVPIKLSKEIKAFSDGPRRGFGSIPVKLTIGKTTWKTSIFPEKKGTFFLPLKKDVRKKENIKVGKSVEVEIAFQ